MHCSLIIFTIFVYNAYWLRYCVKKKKNWISPSHFSNLGTSSPATRRFAPFPLLCSAAFGNGREKRTVSWNLISNAQHIAFDGAQHKSDGSIKLCLLKLLPRVRRPSRNNDNASNHVAVRLRPVRTRTNTNTRRRIENRNRSPTRTFVITRVVERRLRFVIVSTSFRNLYGWKCTKTVVDDVRETMTTDLANRLNAYGAIRKTFEIVFARNTNYFMTTTTTTTFRPKWRFVMSGKTVGRVMGTVQSSTIP